MWVLGVGVRCEGGKVRVLGVRKEGMGVQCDVWMLGVRKGGL